MWRHFLLSSSINKTGLKYLTSKKGLMTTLGCLLKGLLILEKVVELTAQSVLFALLNDIYFIFLSSDETDADLRISCIKYVL